MPENNQRRGFYTPPNQRETKHFGKETEITLPVARAVYLVAALLILGACAVIQVIVSAPLLIVWVIPWVAIVHAWNYSGTVHEDRERVAVLVFVMVAGIFWAAFGLDVCRKITPLWWDSLAAERPALVVKALGSLYVPLWARGACFLACGAVEVGAVLLAASMGVNLLNDNLPPTVKAVDAQDAIVSQVVGVAAGWYALVRFIRGTLEIPGNDSQSNEAGPHYHLTGLDKVNGGKNLKATYGGVVLSRVEREAVMSGALTQKALRKALYGRVSNPKDRARDINQALRDGGYVKRKGRELVATPKLDHAANDENWRVIEEND
jgi:hypothetical protein